MMTWWLVLAGFTVVRDPVLEEPIRWATPSIAFVVQQDGSDDVTDGSDVTAMENGALAWNGRACSSLVVTASGRDSSRTIAQDGVNRITFLESNWPGGANGAGAFTVRYRDAATTPNTWTEADIRINGEGFTWDTRGGSTAVDIQSVVAHEVGHAVGLAHSVTPEATMYFVTSRGITNNRTLHADDVAGLCFIYPAMSTPCLSDADCPLLNGLYGGADVRMRCQTGACVVGAAALGVDCMDDTHCATGPCAPDPVMPPAYEPGVCTQPCTLGAADCPAGSYCSAAAGPPLCYPGRDCAVPADCPAPNPMCRRDQDGHYHCLHACEQNRHCQPTQVCFWGTGAPPDGFCETPGPLGVGAACDDGLQCASLACTLDGVQPSCAAGTPGFVVDAGPPPPDAALPADAAAQPDSAVTPDAAVELPDAAVAVPDAAVDIPDAMVALPDAAQDIPDAATELPDASVPDAALPAIPDAAMIEDAAVRRDAAVPPTRDAAVMADASTGEDAAATPPPQDPAPDAGCHCGNSTASTASGWLLMAALAVLSRRKRQHR